MNASRLQRFFARHAIGIHYAVRIFLGTTLLWLLFRRLGDGHVIWAIIAMIFVTEPHPRIAMESFRLRMLNTALGCGVAMLALLVAGPLHWILPVAVTLSVLIAVRAPQSPAAWRVAPIAAAVVLAAGMAEQSRQVGLQIALVRAGEVLLGGATALVIAWLMARVWMPQEPGQPPPAADPPENPPPEKEREGRRETGGGSTGY